MIESMLGDIDGTGAMMGPSGSQDGSKVDILEVTSYVLDANVNVLNTKDKEDNLETFIFYRDWVMSHAQRVRDYSMKVNISRR
jgi:hypothetical protein